MGLMADFQGLAERVADRKLPPTASTIPIITQRRRRVPQEQEDDEHHQPDADRHRQLHPGDRGPDGLGAVAEYVQHHLRRQGPR